MRLCHTAWVQPKTVLLLCLGVVLAQTDYLGASCNGKVCDNGLDCLTSSGTACLYGRLDDEEQCTCGGVGQPPFTGFLGQKFDFSSEPDTTYALLSEQEHSVNAHFVTKELASGLMSGSDLIAELPGVIGVKNASTVGSLAISHKTTRLLVSADHLGELTVEVDGQQLVLGADISDFQLATFQDRILPSGMHIAMGRLECQQAFIIIETDLIYLDAFPIAPYIDDMGSNVRGHLSLELSLKTEPNYVHGVLGQTIYEDKLKQGPELRSFPGEGEASSYEVSSIFGTDFEFNLFGTTMAEAKHSIAHPDLDSQSTALSFRKLLAKNAKQKGKMMTASFGIIGDVAF